MTGFDLVSPAHHEHRVIGLIGRTIQTLWRWGLASSRARQLDELISREDRASTPELCEVRARQLVRGRRRVAIAAQIETCVEMAAIEAGGSRRHTSVWLVDLPAAEVRAAATELLDLATALRSAEPAEPRGVAMAMLLVRDGESPLYVADGPGEIAKAANAARMALSARPLG